MYVADTQKSEQVIIVTVLGSYTTTDTMVRDRRRK